MTSPTSFIRSLILDSLEGYLDSGLNLNNPRDAQDLHVHTVDCLRALNFLERAVDLTGPEIQTLLLLIDFHDGIPEDEAPFNVQAANSARAKLNG